MKKLYSLALILPSFLICLSSSPAHAYPISVGQVITLQNGPGNDPGGEFIINDLSGNTIHNTFCLETNEYISFGTQYRVADISTEARAGGFGGTKPDPLSLETAYLFYNFYVGTLSEYAYSNAPTTEFSNRAASATALQKAIWHFEGEQYAAENYYTTLASAAVNSGSWSDLGPVRVINLQTLSGQNAQDQLTVVPEPASMLLMGSGLLAFAAFRRKLRKK